MPVLDRSAADDLSGLAYLREVFDAPASAAPPRARRSAGTWNPAPARCEARRAPVPFNPRLTPAHLAAS